MVAGEKHVNQIITQKCNCHHYRHSEGKVLSAESAQGVLPTPGPLQEASPKR